MITLCAVLSGGQGAVDMALLEVAGFVTAPAG